MDDAFDLPVQYKGEEVFFSTRLLQLGYTHKFAVDVHGTEVFFEPDEEGSYRAIVAPEQMSKELNVQLLEAITHGIKEVLK